MAPIPIWTNRRRETVILMAASFNRLSVGVQSFNAAHLKALGRIHDSNDAKTALAKLNTCGFDNWNLDLMVGLPNQTLEEALEDLQTALDFNPPHLSWYQLTLEPNTLFHKYPPPLPEEEVAYHMHTLGHERLAEQGYLPYEVWLLPKSAPACITSIIGPSVII